jgi:hypothetical protein
MEHSPTTSQGSKRAIIVAFRLTASEAGHVEEAAAALKRPRTRGDFCRAAALYIARQRVPEPAKPVRLPPRRLPALDTQLLSKLLAAVGQLGHDLNQVANLIRQPCRECSSLPGLRGIIGGG